MNVSAIPNEFLCPITGEIMVDPVNVCAEGHIFERSAINQWSTQGQNNCPTCRTPLGSHRPERHLKQSISDWLAAHPQPFASSSVAPFKDGVVAVKAVTFTDKDSHYLSVTVETDSAGDEQGCLIIVGADNSGSMAELVDPDNKEISYTRMDFLKHTVNTVAAMLSPKDSLAVVSFSTTAKVVLEPTRMDDSGRAKLKAVLQTVQPDAMTNIDAAIRSMMSIANRPEHNGRAIFGALLTDGAETVTPSPSGTVNALSRLKMTNPWSFSTFGFSNDVNSILLTQLAEMPLSGGGRFGFIPDLTMIGTVFINWVAGVKATGTRDALIRYSINGSHASFNTGPLAIGQPRDFLLPIPAGASVKVFEGATEIPVHPLATFPEFSLARNMYIASLEQAIAMAESGRTDNVFPILGKVITRFADSTDERVKALMLDIESTNPNQGQIGMAARYWKTWGAPYMRAYRRAQQTECRMNFKDPGSLIYGGSESSRFGQLAAKGEDIFMTLEPPQPSGRPQASSYGGGGRAYDPATLSAYVASQYQSTGCFHGNNMVRMADGSERVMKDLGPGDQVWTPLGAGTVKFFVTMNHGSTTSLMMSRIGDCILTPYHPYLDGYSNWVLGADTVGQELYPTGTIFNLVLDRGHIISVGGVRACTLAHGFQDSMVKHEFFGTKAVIDCLSRCDGFSEGRPTFKNLQGRRQNGVIVEWFDAP